MCDESDKARYRRCLLTSSVRRLDKWRGGEAVIHALHRIFEADDTDAVLLIDASNAFNSLERAAALHNTRILCPSISNYAINIYR